LLIGLILLVRSFIVPGEPLGQFALKAGVPIILSTLASINPSTAVHSKPELLARCGTDQHQHQHEQRDDETRAMTRRK
jgi:hypothetical protein